MLYLQSCEKVKSDFNNKIIYTNTVCKKKIGRETCTSWMFTFVMYVNVIFLVLTSTTLTSTVSMWFIYLHFVLATEPHFNLISTHTPSHRPHPLLLPPKTNTSHMSTFYVEIFLHTLWHPVKPTHTPMIPLKPSFFFIHPPYICKKPDYICFIKREKGYKKKSPWKS